MALLSTLSKALKLVVAQYISYIVNRYTLLPSIYLGGHKGISTNYINYLLLN